MGLACSCLCVCVCVCVCVCAHTNVHAREGVCLLAWVNTAHHYREDAKTLCLPSGPVGLGPAEAERPSPCLPQDIASCRNRGRRGGEACSRGCFFKESSARPAALLAPMQPSPSICPGAFNGQLLCLGHPPAARSLSSKHATWQESQISACEERLQDSPCSTKL